MTNKSLNKKPGTADVASQFFRFSIVGVFGFCVDAAVLYLCLIGLDTGVYLGRLFSYLVAATFTWYVNRKYTFLAGDTSPCLTQWAKFIATNGLGGIVNYTAYVIVVTYWEGQFLIPLAGVAIGSVIGLGFNFTLSRLFVFKKQ